MPFDMDEWKDWGDGNHHVEGLRSGIRNGHLGCRVACMMALIDEECPNCFSFGFAAGAFLSLLQLRDAAKSDLTDADMMDCVMRVVKKVQDEKSNN